MYPSYRWTDSYPHPMHYAPIDEPIPKQIPSHMKMDPNTLNSPYQPWPYSGNYYYPNPIQHDYHNCCNHGYFNGAPYTFRPPYHHYPPPPPPPLHCHGFYPPFPGAYPIPPPHYSVEQPKYDYQNDKNTNTPHHCCGCNHREDDKKLKIEEKQPEVDKKTSDSLVPLLLKDYPYPVTWVPSGYKNAESNAKEKEKHSHDPVVLKVLEEPSKKGGNGGTIRNCKDEEGNRFPFPIFWLPYKNNKVENDKDEKNVVELLKPEEKKSETRKTDEAESEMESKHGGQKVSPVKQAGAEAETKIPKRIETKAKSGFVEKTDDGREKNSSPKASKLPPVCLRIDPLPKKKKSSRSPSPPSKKEISKVNDSRQLTELSEGLKKSKEEQSKGDVKTIEVSNEDVKGEACKVEEEKKKYSEDEAALMIQSAYRGFEVRKSKPLKKLKQIGEVGKQVVELRNRVRDLECVDEKQKVIIGETIMSLLLKLDTIQGLHPVVRDVRKWVAKELVCLQEKLDSLKSETQSKRSMEHVEDDGTDSKVESSSQPVDDSVREAEARCDSNEEGIFEQSTQEINDNQLQMGEDDVIHVEHDEVQTQLRNGEEDEKKCDDDGAKTQVEELTNSQLDLLQAQSVENADKDPTTATLLADMEKDAVENDLVVEDFGDAYRKLMEENEKPDNKQLETKHPVKQSENNATVDEEEDFIPESGNSGDSKLMEENEKLRVAVEDLLKAGNHQLTVIKELTGRVKDLEKKLSKNKKVKLRKGRRRASIVEDELV